MWWDSLSLSWYIKRSGVKQGRVGSQQFVKLWMFVWILCKWCYIGVYVAMCLWQEGNKNYLKILGYPLVTIFKRTLLIWNRDGITNSSVVLNSLFKALEPFKTSTGMCGYVVAPRHVHLLYETNICFFLTPALLAILGGSSWWQSAHTSTSAGPLQSVKALKAVTLTGESAKFASK